MSDHGICRFAQNIIDSFVALSCENFSRIFAGRENLNVPKFGLKQLIRLVNSVEEIFVHEPVFLTIDEPCIIVGDLHGNLLDLIRIFTNFGYPPSQRYLFLGDFIDRGDFSLEVVTLVYALKLLYPKFVLIIRGNHEFVVTSRSGGFSDEVEQMYPRGQLYNHFIKSFNQMPLAARLFKTIFCVHGGLCPDLVNVDQLNSVKRPISDYTENLLCGILWSDPSSQTPYFQASRRGTGYVYGRNAIDQFMNTNNFSLIVRGHECVENGYEWWFDKKLITVFSAANYCGVTMNSGAVFVVKSNFEFNPITILPLPRIARVGVNFIDIKNEPMPSTGIISKQMIMTTVVIGRLIHNPKGNIRQRKIEDGDRKMQIVDPVFLPPIK